MPASWFAGRPAVAATVGALAIAFSGILFRLAEVSAETGAFFRCLYALPPLVVLAAVEDSRLGPRARRARVLALVAGLFFAADLILWHRAIEYVGAGLATVLGNTQVVMVGLVAWVLLNERPARSALAAIPIVFGGVVLISGVVGSGAYGSNPGLGVVFGVLTGVMYTGFLLTLRAGNADLRRPAGPLADATAMSAAACAVAGAALGELDLAPAWESQAWLLLLALSSQVVGWLLISVSLARLPAVLTSILLTLQPVASVVLAAVLVAESPSPAQIAGVAAILLGLIVASVGRAAGSRAPVAEVG